MIEVDLLSVIRRWRHRDQLPIREITRQTGLIIPHLIIWPLKGRDSRGELAVGSNAAG